MTMFNIFLKAAKKTKALIFSLILVLAIYNCCLIGFPLILNNIVSNLQTQNLFSLVLLGGLVIAIPLFSFLEEKLLYKTATRLAIISSSELLEEISKKRYDQLMHHSSDYIVRVVNNFSNTYSNFYLYLGLDAGFTLLTILIMLVIIGINNLYLLIFIVVANTCKIIFISLLNPRIEKKSAEQKKSKNLFLQIFKSYITKTPAILTRNKTQHCLEIMEHLKTDVLNKTKSLSICANTSESINQSGKWIIQISMLLFGLWLLQNKHATLETLQTAFFYSNEICDAMIIISQLIAFYGMIKGNYAMLKEILDYDDTKSSGLHNAFNTLSIQHLSYHYPNQENILKDFNYQFKKGKIYVIQGKNGSGKSTLMKIISGLYLTESDAVYLDHMPLVNYDLQYYQNKLITVLAQSDLLFDTTIEENLLENDQQAIENISLRLNITNRKKKIEQNGINLSGGEKRRILLARAFLQIQRNNPSLIIFDEPFYALDKKTKEIVKNMIEELSKKCITILVSHEEKEDNTEYEYIYLSEISTQTENDKNSLLYKTNQPSPI